MFDSRQYEWADITAILGGRDLTGIRAVKYTEKIEREPLHAKGRYPQSIQSGNVTIEGELGVLQSEYEALVKAGKGSILRLKGLGLTLSYGDPALGDAMTTDQIIGLYFTEAPKDIKQGDKFMDIKLPFVAIMVKNQVS